MDLRQALPLCGYFGWRRVAIIHRHLFKNRAICAPAAMIARFAISSASHGGGVIYLDDDKLVKHPTGEMQ